MPGTSFRSVAAAVTFASLAAAGAGDADTLVPPGNLTLTQSWTVAGSPYVITGDVTVLAGVTLTIEAGVAVEFAAGDASGSGEDATRSELHVDGTLVTQGTALLPTFFRSHQGSPATGDYYGVVVDTGAANITNTDFSHGQSCLRVKGTGAAQVTGGLFDACGYGIEAMGGSPQITGTTVTRSTNYGLYATGGATVTASRLTIRDGLRSGIYLYSSALSLTGSVIHGNAGQGVYLYQSGGTFTTTLRHNTIVGNVGYGVYASYVSGTLNVFLQDSIVASNGGYGVCASSGGIVTGDHNLVWGNTSGNYYNASAGAGSLSENPLFADMSGGDLRPTSRSPARLHASDGGDVGALAYDGAPTVGWQGHLYENTTWSAVGSPYAVLGDLTVETGVTLLMQPGTGVTFAARADSMGGNEQASRAELRVIGRLVVDGDPGNRVTFGSSAASPAPGDWYGIHLLASSASSAIEYAVIRHAVYGIRSEADSFNSVSRSEVATSQSDGIYVPQGNALFDGVLVHHNGASGVYVASASPTLDNLVVHSNSSHGLYVSSLGGSNSVVVNQLTAWGNAGQGAYLGRIGGNLSVTLVNSIVSQNGSYGIYASGSPSVAAGYNDVWGNTSGNYYNVSAGTASISANPWFVDPSLDNFRLLPTSPAIDAADPVTALPVDCEGQSRPIDGNGLGGPQPDMGAYEFRPPVTFELALVREGTGSGRVTSDPAGIDCGATCRATYADGTVVTLTATAATGSTFAGWSGGGCSGSDACVVTMDAAKTVSATFNLDTYLLTVTKSGTGAGTVTSSPAGIDCGSTCSAPYDPGTTVTLTSTAASGSTLMGWSGDGCTGIGTCTVTMDAARNVTATFMLGAGFYTVTPCRFLDTRQAAQGGPLPLAGGSTTVVPVVGFCGVPATAAAVALNVTVTAPTAQGHLTLYPDGTARPQVSVINYVSGQTRANNAVAPLGASGALVVFVGQASGTVHVILDVNGYFE